MAMYVIICVRLCTVFYEKVQELILLRSKGQLYSTSNWHVVIDTLYARGSFNVLMYKYSHKRTVISYRTLAMQCTLPISFYPLHSIAPFSV